MPNEWQCTALTREGDRCRKTGYYRIAGLRWCVAHVKANPRLIDAYVESISEAARPSVRAYLSRKSKSQATTTNG